jgi:hypothetical protein
VFVTVTVKMEAESEPELIEALGPQVVTCRQHFDSLKAEGIFGAPEQCEIRYLVIGGGWRNPTQEAAAQE